MNQLVHNHLTVLELSIVRSYSICLHCSDRALYKLLLQAAVQLQHDAAVCYLLHLD
jgi:hypothetical protein